MRRAGARIVLGVVLLATGLSALASGTAHADVFEPISLASVGTLEHGGIVEQADVAEHPALSGDGRYVAFQGTFGGVTGVWRRDLHTGAIQQVAGGEAALPSISANGQYVSFTTNEGASLPEITHQQPDPTATAKHEAVNVYVRNMDAQPAANAAAEALRPASERGFVIASAPSGSEDPLRYELSDEQLERQYGSVASGRSAISSNGREVAFVTTAISDLVETANDEQAEREGKPPPPETPALQVAVRDLENDETKLVSVEYENGAATDRPVSTTRVGSTTYGAVYGAGVFLPTSPAARSEGASISADGSTVAWMGQEISRQAPVMGGPGSAERTAGYIEPLWRRIEGGAQEPTRRITGGADPANPACAASGETEPTLPRTLTDPCQGPFEASLTESDRSEPGVFPTPSAADFLPRLSANGQVVAFLASQTPLGSGQFRKASESDDLYVVNMADGLSRVQALRRLTAVASENRESGGFAEVNDLSISPDGTEVAFSTKRAVFPLGSPAYVSSPAKPEMEEIYDVDLANDTLTRVTHGYQGEGQQSEPSGLSEHHSTEQEQAGSPSFSEDGNTLAFSSAARNLVYGEDTEADSVFVVSRKRFENEAEQQYISPPPAGPALDPGWLLTVTARSRRDGSVLLEVEAPGAGRLSAGAESAVRVSLGRSRAVAKSRAKRKRARRARSARSRTTSTIAKRWVSTAAKSVRGEGFATLALTLAPSYRSLATRRGGLSASVSISFAAPGHAALRQTLPVTFLSSEHSSHKSAHGSKRRTSKARRRRS